MAIIGDVFGLSSIYEKQVENVDNDNFDSWPESATYGYFAGGINPALSPAYVDTVDRLDFFNETTSTPGNDLSQGRSGLAAVSTSSYGYFGGGLDPTQTPSTVTTVDRLDFSNETTSTNNLPVARTFSATVSTSSYGYFGGGITPDGVVATVQRLEFSNETFSLPGIDLPQARNSLAAVSTSSYGYFGCGQDPAVSPTYRNTVDRIDFSNETTSAPSNNLPAARAGLAAVSSSSYGYFGGGFSTPAPTFYDTVNRLDFSNDTVTTPGNDLPQARAFLSATSNNSYGYFGGGNAPPNVTTVDRIDFSNETFSLPGDNLSQERRILAALSGGASYRISGLRTYGYFGGGLNPALSPIYVDTVERLDFSNETFSLPGDNLSAARQGAATVSSSSYGYFGGGYSNPPSVFYDRVERLDFSNQTFSVSGNPLPQARNGSATVSTSSYGYFGGGFAPPYVTTVERLDFFSETTSTPDKDLSQARGILAAVSNNSYGYFGGGDRPSGIVNTVDRIDFSNETISPPGNNLPEARRSLAAVSTSFYGYFTGGQNPTYSGLTPDYIDIVERLDFSNETFSLPGNDLPQERAGLAAVSSSSYGYFAGGFNANLSPVYVDTVDRIDLSNETFSLASNNLPQTRSSVAAVSN